MSGPGDLRKSRTYFNVYFWSRMLENKRDSLVSDFVCGCGSKVGFPKILKKSQNAANR